MANLYQLTGMYEILQNAVELNPTDEELQAEFDKINDDIETKADNYARIIRNLEIEIDGIEAESVRLAERKASRMNTIKRMKENLMESMKQTGKTKFKTDLFSFGVQKNGGKEPLVLDVKVEDLPDELVKVKREADNEAIRAYIEETGDLTYAHTEERKESLRIR